MSTQFIELGPDSETDLFWWLLFGVFTGGFLLGVKATLVYLRLCGWWTKKFQSHQSRTTLRLRPGWESIVVRALRFIRKRRKIALAFNNYRTKPLRHSPESSFKDRPSQGWLHRSTGSSAGVPPLQEGPVFRHGSD